MVLEEVARGLRNGLSYKRTISEGVEEYIRPVWDSYRVTVGYTSFEHTVIGPDWGGANEMPIKSLFNGHFSIDDWSIF